jgi:hypothetical protein
MAQTVAQKKALAAAQALIKKQQASLKKLEAEQKTMTDTQVAVDKQLTDDAYYTKTLASGKTQAQIDALRDAYNTAESIRLNSPTMTSRVDRTTGKVITTVDPNKGKVVDDDGNDGNDDGDAASAAAITAAEAAKLKLLSDQEAARIAEEKRVAGQSAYDLLYSQFKQYGLGSLVEPLKGLITSGASPAEFTIKLRETDAYKKRFAANAARVQKGLSAISEAEYLGLEDQYQSIMRNYGLPESYYARGEMGAQEGFNKFIANDVSAAELEDRVMTAQNRVMNANPEVLASLKAFYPDINNGDILAYTLDPTKGLDSIKRKVTAAEIGGAAIQSGLNTGVKRAEELGAAGITKLQAQQGFGTIAGGLQRGSQLASIYGENPYTQTTAEQEVFGLAGKTEAEKQRKKLTSLETATFGGQSGVTSGALARDRAGTY